MGAERVLILHQGDGEVAPDPLARTGTYAYELSGGRAVVAVVVWADEVNAWVRRVVPQHMARVQATGMTLTRRPGWQRPAGEDAPAFVAAARDGDGRRFR
ncbi:hypothetical protein [Streptomyces swartbergensis]|nr:hypothetical protein [Streptomyces swartbergensis]